MIDQTKLEEKISELLSTLYDKRFATLNGLKLEKLLQKNPYLYRAMGFINPNDFIEQVMTAFISSSDETIFGNDFFEPLAKWAAKEADQHGDGDRIVTYGGAPGQDIAIETATEYLAVSVKSGKNIFNTQSAKGQHTEFDALRTRLRKVNKQFRAIIGYGYGRKSIRQVTSIEKVAGQMFWSLITGEEDFYLRIAEAMKRFASEHKATYEEAYCQKRNQLLRQFMINFVVENGNINWDAVVTYNSSSSRPKRLLTS